MNKKKIKISDPKSLHKKRQFLYDTTLNYRNSFLDKQKNRYKSKYLEKRNCPVCNSSKKKDIFFAVEGTQISGKRFINEAISRGASAIVSGKKIKLKKEGA